MLAFPVDIAYLAPASRPERRLCLMERVRVDNRATFAMTQPTRIGAAERAPLFASLLLLSRP